MSRARIAGAVPLPAVHHHAEVTRELRGGRPQGSVRVVGIPVLAGGDIAARALGPSVGHRDVPRRHVGQMPSCAIHAERLEDVRPAPGVEADAARGFHEERGQGRPDIRVSVPRARSPLEEVRPAVVLASGHEVALEERAERDRGVAVGVQVVPDRPAIPDARRVGQQMPDGDGPPRMLRRSHRERQDVVHVVVEVEQRSFDRLHDGRRDHGLRDRCQHEQRALSDRFAPPEVRVPISPRPHDVLTSDYRCRDAREPAEGHEVRDLPVEVRPEGDAIGARTRRERAEGGERRGAADEQARAQDASTRPLQGVSGRSEVGTRRRRSGIRRCSHGTNSIGPVRRRHGSVPYRESALASIRLGVCELDLIERKEPAACGGVSGRSSPPR